MKRRPPMQVDAVAAAIIQAHGLIGPAAEILGTTRTRLKFFVQRHPSCARALAEAREGLVDRAEQRLYDLVEAGDYRAIAFVLSTLGKERGYQYPKGTAVQMDNSTTVIEAVNVISIPRGHFLPRKEPAIDMPSVRIGAPPSLTVIDGGGSEDETLQ